MGSLKQRQLQPGQQIRVLVVDDSAVIRRLVTQVLEQEPIIEVVGTASNGSIGLQRIPQYKPDLVILDIEMPGMNGLEMLRRMRSEYPDVRVIMFSTLTERGAAITLEALSLGADDYVAKVSNEVSLDHSLSRLRDEMVPKIKQFFRWPVSSTAAAESLRVRPARAGGQPGARSFQKRSGPRVVLIGVSTGGPAALSTLLPLLPATFPLPVMVVQHMPPLFTRLLAERLNANCQLRVEEATHGVRVLPGKILIAPGDFHMKVSSTGGTIQVLLDQSPAQNSCRPAVDVLFASAAEVYGGTALAVVLTGMGQDGLRGAELLKAQGATVLVQDEATSVVWGMPGAVVHAGLADHVVPLQKIVPEILRIAAKTQESAVESRSSGAAMSPENYRFLQQRVHSEVGIVFEEDKQYLFDSRLAPILQQLGLQSLDELCALLRAGKDPQLNQQIAEAMTTNETYFFRDAAQYTAIRSVLLPKLKELRRESRKLRFWSAASSTGQEAFSFAMILLEEGMGDWNVRILGTDYSPSVVARARSGKYKQVEVNRGLPPSLLARYFHRCAADWQLNDAVRRMAVFETIDLRSSMRELGRFDLVFCRNVLIYFDNDTRRNIIKEIHSTLYPGGWLLLGGAETGFGMEEWFDRIIVEHLAVYVAR